MQKTGKRAFKQAALEGGSRIEIYMDHRETKSICILWSKHCPTQSPVRKLLEPFFSADGTLLSEPIPTFTKIQKMISAIKRGSIKSKIRISSHIEETIQRQYNKAQSHRAKENFMSDLKQGKHSLNIMKIPLYPYQEEEMLHLAFTERALLADEMGLGKTVQAIAACQLLSQLRDIKKVLVIATASLKAEWVEQINKFSALQSLVIEGSRANRLAQYQHSSFFYLTNYEQILIDGSDIQRCSNKNHQKMG